MLIVLDTNVIVSGVLWGGKPGQLLQACIEEKVINHTSPDIIKELERVLNYSKFQLTEGEIIKIVNLVLNVSKVIRPEGKIEVVDEDPGDNKYLECAVASKSNYIVSGDKHLLKLGTFGKIKIVKPSEMIKLL